MSDLCKHSIGKMFVNPIGEKCLCCEIWDCQRNIDLGDCLGNCEDQDPVTDLSLEDIAFLLSQKVDCKSCPFNKKCYEGGGGTNNHHCEDTFYEWLKSCEESG